MARTKSLQEQADSQEAICDYMYYKAENEYMHSARVLVTSFGEIKYSNILTIIPNIGTNDARVYIEGDSKFERNYYLEYSNRYFKAQEEIELPKRKIEDVYEKEVIPQIYKELIERK